jgi:hypothetical protein
LQPEVVILMRPPADRVYRWQGTPPERF